MYRDIHFNNERKWKVDSHRIGQDDVLQVGKHKAIGYIVQSENDNFQEMVLDNYQEMDKIFKKDNKLSFINCHELGITTLWVGDALMMQEIIDKNINLLKKHNMPLEANIMFEGLASDKIRIDHEENCELYHFICELFNSWCLWCEKPIVINGEFFSENPT